MRMNPTISQSETLRMERNEGNWNRHLIWYESDKLTHQQCKDVAWNFRWWSNWLKSCMRMNPTINQSWTQIRTECCKGNTGRYYETSLFWALPIGMVEYLMNQYYRSGSHYPALVPENYLLWFYIVASPPFDERSTGSIASCPNLFGSQLGLFVGSFIGWCNRVKWLTRTWFPATELRLVNAFAWLAERTSVNSPKNFKRAGIAFILFLFIA